MNQMLTFRRAGAGKPLILIHGFLGGAGVWLAQQVYLKGAFDVIAVDLPGFAASPLGKSPNSMQAYVAEILDLADGLGLQRFSVLGWSFGGMIAQQIALDCPERVERLVLCATAAVGELPHRFESWAQTLARIKSEGIAVTTDRTVRTWFVDQEANPFYRICQSACDGATEAACAGAIKAMESWSAIGRLQEISSPALVIVGDRDRSTTPADSFILRQGLPFASLAILPNCAHGAHMERPDLFNRIVADFLIDTTH
jgi:2-hydroxy-6-oxonona-2,4-dienedioate hydrolase